MTTIIEAAEQTERYTAADKAAAANKFYGLTKESRSSIYKRARAARALLDMGVTGAEAGILLATAKASDMLASTAFADESARDAAIAAMVETLPKSGGMISQYKTSLDRAEASAVGSGNIEEATGLFYNAFIGGKVPAKVLKGIAAEASALDTERMAFVRDALSAAVLEATRERLEAKRIREDEARANSESAAIESEFAKQAAIAFAPGTENAAKTIELSELIVAAASLSEQHEIAVLEVLANHFGI